MTRIRMKAFVFFLFWGLFRPSFAQDIIFAEIPATNIKFSVESSVIFDARGDRFTYGYIVTSSTTSQQDIWLFDIAVDTVMVRIGGILNPNDGWDGSIAPRGALNWVQIHKEHMIRPGKSAQGFGFTSQNPPGISTCFAQGDVPLGGTSGWVDENTPTPIEFEKNVIYQTTIGPSPFTFTTPSTAIDRLIALKHQSSSLGWLGDAKFVLKLGKRLDQAKAALARDKKKLARVRLSQFVRELTKAYDEHKRRDKRDEHHGKKKDDHKDNKFVNDEAFQLLKINADFIIAKLPTKAKDKDEEDECRRAEAEKDDDHDDDKNKSGKPGKGGRDD